MSARKPILFVISDDEVRYRLQQALESIDALSKVHFIASHCAVLAYLDRCSHSYLPELLVLGDVAPPKRHVAIFCLHQLQQRFPQLPLIIYSAETAVVPPQLGLPVLTRVEPAVCFEKTIEQVRYFTELVADDIDILLGL